MEQTTLAGARPAARKRPRMSPVRLAGAPIRAARSASRPPLSHAVEQPRGAEPWAAHGPASRHWGTKGGAESRAKHCDLLGTRLFCPSRYIRLHPSASPTAVDDTLPLALPLPSLARRVHAQLRSPDVEESSQFPRVAAGNHGLRQGRNVSAVTASVAARPQLLR